MKKVFFLVAVATLALLSCQKELEQTVEPVENNGITLTASVEDFSSDTKADMDADRNLVWAKGDKIGVYVNDASWTDKNQPFTLKGDGGEKTGTFVYDYDSGVFTNPNATAAFFPWQGTGTDKNNVYEGNVYFKLPYEYVDYKSGQMLTPLVAPMTYNAGAYEPIEFKHAGAAVKLNVTNIPVDSYIIQMNVDGQQVYGDYHIAVADAGTADMVVDGTPNPDYNSINIYYDEITTAGQPFTFIFPVPALTTPKLEFIITDVNGVPAWHKKLKAQTKSIAHGQVLNLTPPAIVPYERFNTVSSEWTVCGNFNGDNFSVDVPMVTDGEFHIAKGIVFNDGEKFKVRKNKDWGEAYGDPSNSADYENFVVTPGGTYDIIFVLSSKVVYVVNSGVDYPDAGSLLPHHTSITGATELGASEHANCYIIDTPGSYKIKAVKGNSSTKAGDVAGVELLWETYNNATDVVKNSVIAAVDYDVDDKDYIYFKTPDTLQPGNALIAAKNAAGEIIWSWHIWIPNGEIQTSTYGYIYNHELMDRNLGALVAATTSSVPVESFGLLYEWGRKDPFVGVDAISGSDFAKISGTPMDIVQNTTLEETILHPTTYAVFYDDTKTDKYWGNWTNETGANNLWKDAEKTIYDPCPAGYRVPAYNSSQPLHNTDLSTVKGWSDNAASGTNAAYFTLGTPATVFPFTGLLSEAGDEVSYNGARNFIWTAEANSSNNGRMMDVRQNKSTHTVTTTVTSRGCTVRCVKVEEAPAPPAPTVDITSATDLSASGSANCYVVYANDTANKDKVFKFKAVKGNSTESVGEVAGVSIVWETYNNDQTVEQYSVISAVGFGTQGSDCYIGFKMPSTLHAGNALIAAKNASDEILWSWHIWVPADEYTVDDFGISSKNMMSRNLGALVDATVPTTGTVDVRSFGLFYQWGRKDPFVSSKRVNSSSHATVAGQDWTKNDAQMTVAQTIANPTKYANFKGDWLATHDNELWGDSGSKTIYDPCPYGYRVAKKIDSDPMWSTTTDVTSFEASTEKLYWKIGDAVFPLCGYIYYSGSISGVGTKSVIWNIHRNNDDAAYCQYTYWDEDSSSSTYQTWQSHPTWGQRKASGGSVRCIVDE